MPNGAKNTRDNNRREQAEIRARKADRWQTGIFREAVIRKDGDEKREVLEPYQISNDMLSREHGKTQHAAAA